MAEAKTKFRKHQKKPRHNLKKMVGKKKRFQIKKKSDSGMIIINPTNKAIAPEVAYCCFNTEIDYFCSNNAAGLSSWLVAVSANNLDLPWNTSLQIGSVAGTTITSGSGATGSLQCAGFSNWIGNSSTTGIYTNFLVLGAMCELEVFPQALGDTCAVGICGYNPNKPTDTPNSLTDFSGKPYSKQKMLSSSKGDTKIKMYIPMHKFFGLSKHAFEEAAGIQSAANETSSPYGGSYISAPLVNANFALLIRTADNVAPSNNVFITAHVKVKYYVKMYNPRRQTMQVS